MAMILHHRNSGDDSGQVLHGRNRVATKESFLSVIESVSKEACPV
jgi:hypothetical protein